MNFLMKLILLTSILYQSESVDPSFLRGPPKTDSSNEISHSPEICDKPAPISIDPEKCCKFPTFFDDSISKKCEDENGVNDTAIGGDMVSDSCLIECMFNKSGLNKGSKLHREDVQKFMNATKGDDSAWSQLVQKAVDTCFNELSDEDLEEIAEHIKNEVNKNNKSLKKICHPVTSIMLDCIYRELYKVCPKEKFTSDLSECVALQNYTKTCDDW